MPSGFWYEIYFGNRPSALGGEWYKSKLISKMMYYVDEAIEETGKVKPFSYKIVKQWFRYDGDTKQHKKVVVETGRVTSTGKLVRNIKE